MKKFSFFALSALLVMGACSKDDEGPDTSAPKIIPADGRDAIRPAQNEVRSATSGHMHVRFKVVDEDGINQARVDIHHSFDGHSHGKGTTSSDFEHLDYRKIYEAEGATELNIDDNFEDVYWEGSNSVIGSDKHVLAGPYDFVIDASDVNGNQTSFTDNTSYLARFWIERSYAPQISVSNLQDGELEGQPGQNLTVEGLIQRNSASNLSSDITFVWVRLYEEDDHDHDHGHGDDIYEKMWGESQWRSNASGGQLPSNTTLDLSSILSGSNAIELPSSGEHFELLIWVEDANGNVSQKTYHVHAH
ncbi:MAG: DUF4625 domain-containing protein [Cryomorphaceae bacterium]|nr:DUF4625 domain-containing protein [Cryomorphaceae bacterium]